jgi:hypothetical protein
VDPRAEELVQQVLAEPGTAYLREPKWRAAVWAWARAETAILLVTEYLIDLVGAGRLGDLEDPRVAAAYQLLEVAEARATKQRGRLGLDPLSSARLGRDKAAAGVDMAQLMTQLARLEAQGVDVLAGVTGDPNTEGGDDDR